MELSYNIHLKSQMQKECRTSVHTLEAQRVQLRVLNPQQHPMQVCIKDLHGKAQRPVVEAENSAPAG